MAPPPVGSKRKRPNRKRTKAGTDQAGPGAARPKKAARHATSRAGDLQPRKQAKRATSARRARTPDTSEAGTNEPKKAVRKPTRIVEKKRRGDDQLVNEADHVKNIKTPAAKHKRSPVRIGGRRVAKGTQVEIHLPVSEHYTGQPIDIPITVIRGRRSGPRLFLTAAVHGDEVNGVQIIREVLDQLDPNEVRGTVIACPVVNRFGFIMHSRYLPDRRDLNRCFPGNPDGPTAYRYAHNIFQTIMRPCDYGIDLHTAGYQRHNLPQVRGDMSNPAVKRLAKAFGATIIMDKKGAKGTLRQVATEHGVPTIIYEAGETFRFQRDAISQGVIGVLNVMRALGMITGDPVRPQYQIITKTSAWIRADHGGILETFVDAGTLVHKGEAIAAIGDPFGKTRGQTVAPFDGLVVGITTLPMVNPGAPICHLVKLKRTLPTVEAHHGPDTVALADAPVHVADAYASIEVEATAGTPDDDEIEG